MSDDLSEVRSPVPGISDTLWHQFQELQGYVWALDRFGYEQGRAARALGSEGGGSFHGPQWLSPAPHNRQPSIYKLIELCQDVRRGLHRAMPDLALPECQHMPSALCELSPEDGRHWLAFREAIGKLSDWV